MKGNISLSAFFMGAFFITAGNAGIFGVKPQVHLPEIQARMPIDTAPVIGVKREVRKAQNKDAFIYDENRLVVNKPNLKYVSANSIAEEILVPVAVNHVEAVSNTQKQKKRIEYNAVNESNFLDKELVLKEKRIKKLQNQIVEQERLLASLKQEVVLPEAKENNKRIKSPKSEQIELPYKYAKSSEKTEIQKKLQYPKDVKKEFEKVYMSENSYLNSLEDYTDDYDDYMEEEINFDEEFVDIKQEAVPETNTLLVENESLLQGLDAFQTESFSSKDLNKKIEILQMKIDFEEGASSVNNKNIELLSSFASVVLNNPINGVEVYISDSSLKDYDSKKLMAKRLAIVSQILRDQGIKEYQIKPVLSKRAYNSVVLKIIDLDTYKQTKIQKTDVFGNVIKDKAYRAIDW